jgi:hypothetical protein
MKIFPKACRKKSEEICRFWRKKIITNLPDGIFKIQPTKLKLVISAICGKNFSSFRPKLWLSLRICNLCNLAKYALGLAYILTFRAQRVFLRAEYNMK